MTDKIKVLFICIHNSARSQMAEAFLKNIGGDDFEVDSAGLEPGKLNPVVVDAMKELGIDISGNKTKSVFEVYQTGKSFDYVVTVCDIAANERCPVFPGARKMLHWPFPDPSAMNGTYEEKLETTRIIRNAIRNKVVDFVADVTSV